MGSFFREICMHTTKLVMLLCLLVVVGCGTQISTVDNGINVAVADAEIVNKSIADKKGNVVLVNFWATWCEPCVEEFPDMVMLYNKYKESGLDVITISYDFEDQIESHVIPYLEKENADFTNLIQGEDVVDQDFMQSIDGGLKGVLPTTLLYDRNGTRQHLILGKFNTVDLEEKIISLLDE